MNFPSLREQRKAQRVGHNQPLSVQRQSPKVQQNYCSAADQIAPSDRLPNDFEQSPTLPVPHKCLNHEKCGSAFRVQGSLLKTNRWYEEEMGELALLCSLKDLNIPRKRKPISSISSLLNGASLSSREIIDRFCSDWPSEQLSPTKDELIAQLKASAERLFSEDSRSRCSEGEGVLCQWDDCNCRFGTIAELVEHLYVHISAGFALFVCRWRSCDRDQQPFDARYKLEQHLRKHTGEKPHKCMRRRNIVQFCPKEYSRQENLKTHIRSHDSVKPYPCRKEVGCEAAFTNASDRAKHENRTHSHERLQFRIQKPFACEEAGCSKSYTDPSSLRKHIKTVHGVSVYEAKKERNKKRRTGQSRTSAGAFLQLAPYAVAENILPVCSRLVSEPLQFNSKESYSPSARCPDLNSPSAGVSWLPTSLTTTLDTLSSTAPPVRNVMSRQQLRGWESLPDRYLLQPPNTRDESRERAVADYVKSQRQQVSMLPTPPASDILEAPLSVGQRSLLEVSRTDSPFLSVSDCGSPPELSPNPQTHGDTPLCCAHQSHYRTTVDDQNCCQHCECRCGRGLDEQNHGGTPLDLSTELSSLKVDVDASNDSQLMLY